MTRVPVDPRILHWGKGSAEENFGDFLSEFFAETILMYPKVDVDVFHLVGSVIDADFLRRDLRHSVGSMRGRVAFWGCGTRSERGIDPVLREACLFFGVRGPLTRTALGLPDDTVLGDTGLLMPLLHTPRRSARTAGRTICIPHIFDLRPHEDLHAMSGADLLCWPGIAPTTEALRALIDDIVSADFVLSASLHGAIIACAYGRPFAFWDNGDLDAPFKWRDFAASVGIEARFYKTVTEGRVGHAAHVAPRVALPPLGPILEVCPFTVPPALLVAALAHDGRLDPAAARAAGDALEALCARTQRDHPRHLAASHAHRAWRTSLRGALHRAGGHLVIGMRGWARRRRNAILAVKRGG